MRVGRRTLYKSSAAFAATSLLPVSASAQPRDEVEARVRGLVLDLERYVAAGMAAFDVPGTAVGIVAGDRLLYAKGFGRRRKGGDAPVGPKTVFQIGSTTKAFLAATLAIAVDRKKLKWDDRVVDLDPAFSLKDPYVTREFRVYDLLAQRSGLPPYANDLLWSYLYFDAEWLMHSLRFVEPITSFRSTFAYTNITHLIAGRIVVKALDAPDWPSLARREILGPLGMSDASFTAEAIDEAPDHAVGHRWTATGSVAIPFDPSFPYLAGPAGDINASVEDCTRWLRLQIGNGVFAGRRLISTDNLVATRTPKVAMSEAVTRALGWETGETVTYAMGWIVNATPNGRIVWHNGGTAGFGALIVGDRDFITEARRYKHMFGGAMRQAGVIAAAGVYALDHNLERLAEDHTNAKILARGLAEIPGVAIDVAHVETNLVFFDVAGTGLTAKDVVDHLLARRVRMGVNTRTRIRAVTHMDVSQADVERAVAIAQEVLATARAGAAGA
jgi:CubicO group peptidase (beta-lactamase class C family)